MALNPITTNRFRCIAILGHSNADGWATTESLFRITSPSVYRPLGSWQTEAGICHWKNIYMFTSAQPFPLQTDDTNLALGSDIADGEWLEMTIANPQAPGDPHPHPSPFNYANNQGACYPRFVYEAWPLTLGYGWESGGAFPSSPLDSPTGPWFNDQPRLADGIRHGIEIPLAKMLQSYWGDQIGFIKVAFSSTFLYSIDSGFGGPPSEWLDPIAAGGIFSPSNSGYLRSGMDPAKRDYYGYWTPRESFDWNPASGRLYDMFVRKMNAARAALPPGTTMDLDAVIVWFGDNDSLTQRADDLRTNWERNVRSVISRLRNDAVRYGWTQQPPGQLKIIWPHVHYGYPGPSSDDGVFGPSYCNAVLDEVAADDEFMVVLPSWGWPTLTQDQAIGGISPIGVSPGNHYGSSGYLMAAEAAVQAIEAMDTERDDVLPEDDTITVSEAMSRVRQYYGRSRSNVDIDDQELLQHLNGAVRHVFNAAGDNVWWTRRRKRFSIAAGPTTIHTFPPYVDRVLKIEAPDDPDYPLQFDLIGHGDGGRVKIQMRECSGGDYWVQFMTMPRRLTADYQRLPLPEQVSEWVVAETCRRLAASASNDSLRSHFEGESAMLQMDALRHMGQHQRARKQRLKTQRRRPNLGYGRGGYWGMPNG